MRYILITALAIMYCTRAAAQTDTLRVMGYNVLYYGSGCQGPNGPLHHHLATIVQYANPDIISLEKMASIPVSAQDKYGSAPLGFADSIMQYALDAAYPGRYAYCPFTNAAHTTSAAMVFYDKRKLGFLSIVSSYVNVTDFNIYKLYCKDPALSVTHDTCFLYVIPNHDLSGDENEAVRGIQIAGVVSNIKAHFTRLPNMINLGDFNVRSSKEPFYQTLTNPADTNFRFYDPPFYPDHKLTYPADWNHNADFAAYFTTSTRESASEPNGCGTGGGGKNWYDHIFLSPSIAYGTGRIRYLPGSYRTIGNDGQRFKISIINKNTHTNTAAPADVIDALYYMSNKYPVMATLLVNTAGPLLTNTEIAGAKDIAAEQLQIDSPVGDKLVLHVPASLQGQEITIDCIDKDGKVSNEKTTTAKGPEMALKCKLPPGPYTIKITGHHNIIAEVQVVKE